MDRRCIILIAIQICFLSRDSIGQINAGNAPPSVSTPALSVTAGDPGVLILIDGRVVKGRLTPRPDGYDVELVAGRLFISSDRVRFVARDLSEAYDRMRASQPSFSPDVHLNLARWCLNHQLPEQARREVLDALHLDPNRQDARRMLEALLGADSEHPNSGTLATRTGGSGLTEYPSVRQVGGPAIEMRSLAGLSRPVAQEFTRHVQPLMMNKCANSGCHGSRHGGTFQLISTHRGTSPAIAERNLAAVLKHVDLTNPAASPLLEALDGSHGGVSSPVFRGRSGSSQMAVLRQWVHAAAHDIAPQPEKQSEDDSEELQLASATHDAEENGLTSRNEFAGGFPHPSAETVPHGDVLSRAETDRRLLKQAIRANARDSFDPAEFNAKYHGHSPAETSAEPKVFSQSGASFGQVRQDVSQTTSQNADRQSLPLTGGTLP